MSALVDALSSAAHQVWAVRVHIIAVVAAVCASYLLWQILVRLDRDSRRSVGRDITRLVFLLLIMLVAAHTAWRNVNVTYGAAALVLLIGGSARYLWPGRRRAWQPEFRVGPSGGRIPRASAFLLQGGGLLLLLLWVVQHALTRFTPTQFSPGALLTTFVGTGLLAMAIVQGLRTLLPLRGVFHRLALERWIAEARAEPFLPSVGSEPPTPASPRGIRRALTRLAQGPVAADKYALLDLPIEQLCGQIAAGADRLLDEPSLETVNAPGRARGSVVTVSDVLTTLAAGPRDVDRFLQLADALKQVERQADRKERASESLEQPPALWPTVAPEPLPEPPDSREYMRVRANLSQRIQRNIDGLQIATTFWWRRTLRGLVFVICGVEGLSVFPGDVTLAAVCAVVGGFVATASRDVIAIVEKARR